MWIIYIYIYINIRTYRYNNSCTAMTKAYCLVVINEQCMTSAELFSH